MKNITEQQKAEMCKIEIEDIFIAGYLLLFLITIIFYLYL